MDTTDFILSIKKKYYNWLALLIIVFLIIIELIGIYFYAYIRGNTREWLSLLLLLSFASLAAGSIIGFIFGIPKVNKRWISEEKYQDNTNFEEISDWLTKIIVGLTLIQLIKVPSFIRKIVEYILNTAKCPESCKYFDKPIIICIILINLIIGFYIGYIYSRFFLLKLSNLIPSFSLAKAENEEKDKEIDALKNSLNEIKNKINLTSISQQANLQQPNVIQDINNILDKVNLIINSLTKNEREFLKEILIKKNNYKITKILNFMEFVAIKSLSKKGIIESDKIELGLGSNISIREEYFDKIKVSLGI
jgi:hypothetical protein